MIILKFGGTSVSSIENFKRIQSILSKKKDNYIVVVSAFSKITTLLENIANQALNGKPDDLLEELRIRHFSIIKETLSFSHQTDALLTAQQKCNELEALCNGISLLKELSPRTKALLLSYGEQLSSSILYKYLITNNVEIEPIDSRKLLVANGDYLNAEVDFNATNQNIITSVATNKNYITGGFIASNSLGETVLLGRGGSDYSAAIYASALNADLLEIWSDVNGIHQANPKKVKNTAAIKNMSYEEAFELAYFGAKVLYPPSVIPVREKKIPIRLKNTFYPEQEGTLVNCSLPQQQNIVKGLSSLNNIAIITVSGVGLTRQKGRARQVFQVLEENGINSILITQSCSEQSIGIGIDQNDLTVAEKSLNYAFKQDIDKGIINKIKVTRDQCIIALVGDNMKSKVGLSGKVFSVIGENGINVTAIAQGASERNISIVIDEKEEKKALNVIHEKFFGHAVKKVHLFIAGIGNVGRALLEIIYLQQEKLIKEHRIKLIIVGVANSSHFLFNKKGMDIHDIDQINKTGVAYNSFSEFVQIAKDLNLRNSIFIDNTAAEVVSNSYSNFLKESMSVVTCNKIACSDNLAQYLALKKLTKEHNCYFKYETSVGAALPIIKTIQDLLVSGDEIHKIEAVISGSLNYIFNEYNEEKEFSDVVLQAQKEGYTEPNPLIDLSGLDVMRKILILSREAGRSKELTDISFQHFLPKDCVNAQGNESLFLQLKKNENHFKSLFEKANKKGCKLKVVATLNKEKLAVELREIPPHSPLYNLEGKDNVVSINTNRYDSEPLVIKGAGAGASVTASGVFADLMSIINQ